MQLQPAISLGVARRSLRHCSARRTSPFRAGVTLVELLVVILIMLMITAISIPIVAPALSNRQIREAARLVDVFFNGAKTRAQQMDRSVGVVIEQDVPGGATTLSYAEVPDPYAGDQTSSTINVTTRGGSVLNAAGNIFNAGDVGWYGLVRPGDLVQFNFHNTLYRIYAGEPYWDVNGNGVFDANTDWYTDTNGNSSYDPAPSGVVQTDGYFSFSSSQTAMYSDTFNNIKYSPWTYTYADPALAASHMSVSGGSSIAGPQGALSFQIIRQPVPLASGKLQLPAAAAIDLGVTIGNSTTDAVAVAGSGFDSGDYANFRSFPMPPLSSASTAPAPYTSRVIVTFNPSGVVDLVYAWDEPVFTLTTAVTGWQGQRVTGPIYFLVGRRELLGGDPVLLAQVTTGVAPQQPCFNYQDPSNLWVVINSQTGMVSTTQNSAVDLTAAPPPQNAGNQNSLQTFYSTQVWQARAIAREMQAMGEH